MKQEVLFKARQFLQDRKNSNNLVNIISELEDDKAAPSTVLAIEVVFNEVLQRGSMCEENLDEVEDLDAERLYCEWLKDCYENAWTKMLLLLSRESNKIQAQVVSTLMKLICQEAKHPFSSSSSKKLNSFPLKRLRRLLLALLSLKSITAPVLLRFQEFADYPNVFYYIWHLLADISQASKQPDQAFISNFLDLVSKVPVTQTSSVKGNNDEATEPNDGTEVSFEVNMKHVHSWLNKVWHCMIRWKHSSASVKQLLVLLLEKFLVHLDKPILLTDYLMDCMDIGGPVSLLALQGIFTLIQIHNIEYPNIYGKLYSLFNAEVFYTKYKARLFFLADIFLSSTHLPAHLVAAFAKRLSRLCLVAPPQDIRVLLSFIGNLILRHPELKKLIHHPIGGEVNSDPFIMEERDPVKSCAMDSSLWEVAAIQHHILPSVASAAKFINTPLPSVEWDMHSLLENTENDIFDKETKKKAKEVTLTFERPSSLSLPRGERMLQLWSITGT